MSAPHPASAPDAAPSPAHQRARVASVLRRISPLTRLLHRVALVMLREDDGGQGRHVDPDAPGTPPPVRARWTASHVAAVDSPTLDVFRDALRPPTGGSPRDGVLDELAEYHGISAEVALARCLSWEEESLEEWEAASRDTVDDIARFYDSTQSWAFDLAWYSYLQTSGTGYPKSVVVADRIRPAEGKRLLDFGSGTGVTAQLMSALGCEVTLADVATPLLTFARWRLDRRGVSADYIQLPAELPASRFDVVTALDVMAHVPPQELRATVENLHRSLREGGMFFTGYDVRRRSRTNAWHLYDDDLPLRWEVARAGFRTVELIDGMVWVYRAEPPSRARVALSWVRLASPPARGVRAVRRLLARAALVCFYRVAGR